MVLDSAELDLEISGFFEAEGVSKRPRPSSTATKRKWTEDMTRSQDPDIAFSEI